MVRKLKKIRQLVMILGDQLDDESVVFDDFDPKRDAVWMAEVRAESESVWSHKARIVMFLSAMRHFADGLRQKGIPVLYRKLENGSGTDDFTEALGETAAAHEIGRIIVVEPGELRVRQELEAAARDLGLPLEIRPDRHFFCGSDEFARHASGRKSLRMEYFYRELRKKHDVLMDRGKPTGGKWNYDSQNRGSFSKGGPRNLPEIPAFKPDRVTREVIRRVEAMFPGHPGSLNCFQYPVTRGEALEMLDDFIRHRLPFFGEYQDAMWTDQPFLYHSLLSASLNLKLLNPREVIAAAEQALASKKAPLAAVEGFVRQILGWREYVRGVYRLLMPDYLDRNHLGASSDLPGFYWNGETDMACMRAVISQTLKYGYAHHIQRLMVTGLFALLLGVDPKQVHQWYLAVYIDAVEWVELPNTLGMSQYADGGVMASKPYVASGKYIQRMSHYCAKCPFDPAKAAGENACPFTTLYWDFLMRHRESLSGNIRMSFQLRNLGRKSTDELAEIRHHADVVRTRMAT